MPTDNDHGQLRQFGALIRGHRERLGIPMKKLAQDVALDQGLLSKIERGLRPPPEIVPFVERLARCLQLDPSSTEYRQLVDSAYRGRFGENPPIEKRPAYLVTLGFEKRGLGGLPPELTAPDSPAGRYYKSLGHEVGGRLEARRRSSEVASQAAESPTFRNVPPPQTASPGMVSTPSLEWLMAAGVSEIIKSITRLEFIGSRFTVELLIDGKEYVVTAAPKRKSKRRKRR